jgi:hypothetical protein
MENTAAKFLKNSNLLYLFGIALSSISIITLVLFFISIVFTIWLEGFYSMDFCLSSSCLMVVKEGFSGAIYLIEQGLKLLAVVTAIFGVYIALRNYLVSVSSTALTGHIGYLKLFQEYLTSEVEHKDMLSLSEINIFHWYNKIFPESVEGNVHVSKEYLQNLCSIRTAIQKTNLSLTSAREKYDYKQHQSRLIPAFDTIGIQISRSPKNDFFAAEGQLLELVDAVNMTFSVETEPLTLMDRKYL